MTRTPAHHSMSPADALAPEGARDVHVRELLFAAVALATATLPGAAFAEEPGGALKLKRLSPDGQDACFGRVYDEAHLQSHPKQKVRRIFFYYGQDPVTHPNEEPGLVSSYNAFLTTTVRAAKKPEWTSGWCSEGENGAVNQMRCGSDCDRGMAGLNVDDKGRLRVTGVAPDIYLDPDAEDELGKAEFRRQTLGSDDDNFVLDRLPAQQCKAEFGRIDPVNPALGAPLRERLKPDQPFCFGRDYDPKHMASHKDQATTTIRVLRGPTELASAAVKPEDWPNGADVTVLVTTRTKAAKAAQTYSCLGMGDQWECSAKAGAEASGCEIGERKIYLRRGVDDAMMVANPNGGVPIVDLCGAEGGKATRSDDRVYRLRPMPQDACAP